MNTKINTLKNVYDLIKNIATILNVIVISTALIIDLTQDIRIGYIALIINIAISCISGIIARIIAKDPYGDEVGLGFGIWLMSFALFVVMYLSCGVILPLVIWLLIKYWKREE